MFFLVVAECGSRVVESLRRTRKRMRVDVLYILVAGAHPAREAKTFDS